jgi:hypothetical protein
MHADLHRIRKVHGAQNPQCSSRRHFLAEFVVAFAMGRCDTAVVETTPTWLSALEEQFLNTVIVRALIFWRNALATDVA